MLNIALIGAGTMGQMHASNYREIEGCRVAKVYDVVPEAAETVAVALGAQAVSDVAEAYADDIDIVAVTCPTPQHAEYCCQAASAGKHIFCEKPLARTIQQGEQIVKAVSDAGVIMMVGHVVRFFPEYATATELVKSGAIGDVGMVRTTRINTMPGDPGSWFQDYEQSGGVTLDMIIHDFDWLLWTFGKPKTVYSRALYQHMPTLDYSLTSIRFESGAIAHVEGSWADLTTFRTSFEIAGSNGLIEHDSTQNATFTVQQRQVEEGLAAVQVPSSPAKSPYLVEDELFIEAVAKGNQAPISVDDAFDSLRLALAACESAETDEVINL